MEIWHEGVGHGHECPWPLEAESQQGMRDLCYHSKQLNSTYKLSQQQTFPQRTTISSFLLFLKVKYTQRN